MLAVDVVAQDCGVWPLIVPVRAGHVPRRWQAQAKDAGFDGAADTVCDVLGGTRRVVLTGLGENAEAAGAWAASLLLRTRRIAVDGRGLPVSVAVGLVAGICLRAWHDTRWRTQPDEDGVLLESLVLVTEDAEIASAWREVSAGVEGAMFARDLVCEPSNTLTPQGFLCRLERLVAEGVTLDVLDMAALRAGGFGGLVAVGQGSAHPPCLAVLRWAGTQGGLPVAFVGKGITFDTGGISIKPADHMWEMRADMAGAAACAGAMLALARRRSPAPAMAVLALAENAVGADSMRPGDVVRMVDSTTVQVVDTDAEGRLVLADAIATAVVRGAVAIIDLATLTGSIVVALGHEMAGLFGTDDALAEAVLTAGHAVGEPAWRMPIGEDHRRALDSDIADLKHCVDGAGHPDACQAASFLREFAGGTPWVHLDIAGVESRAEADGGWARGPTGFGVRLLDRLVAAHFEVAG